MYQCADVTPEIRIMASQVYNRSWRFLEQDPVLAGEDRDSLQEQLAELILVLMKEGDRNIVAVANRAIASLRQRYALQRYGVLERAA